ncbi:MAG: ubiquitin-conjugating enzyme E2 [Acidobacteriota bacterium]
MASPRTRRLKTDYELLSRRFAGWPIIQIAATAGLPPEVYRFNYALKGLYVNPSGEILERELHVLEVNLSLDYPRRAPQCRMLTPVFHPNFDDATVCIGDFWAASEGLDDLIVRIGRMIAYQEYNTKSPLNGLAAKWAAEHLNQLPIDHRIVAPPTEGDQTRWIDSSEAFNFAMNIIPEKDQQARQATSDESTAAGSVPLDWNGRRLD